MIPTYLDKNWLDGNFLMPSSKDIRGKLRKNLDSHSCDEMIHLPAYQKVRVELLSRVAAIEAYDLTKETAPHTSIGRHDLPMPRYLFTETWLESGFSIPMDKKRRADLRFRYSGYLNIGEVWASGNEKTRKKLKTYISAIDSIDVEMS